jgi:hypothetical protein
MDITKTQIKAILGLLSYYDPILSNTIKIKRALNRFLNLLDNCPPHPIPEEMHEETLQICRILGEREKTTQERINQINKILAQDIQTESEKNPK